MISFNLIAFAAGVFTLSVLAATAYMLFGHGLSLLASVLVCGQWVCYGLKESDQPVIRRV